MFLKKLLVHRIATNLKETLKHTIGYVYRTYMVFLSYVSRETKFIFKYINRCFFMTEVLKIKKSL
jgi:hypothetical protein